MPLQSRHSWQQYFVRNQPRGCPVEQNAGPIGASPAERIQPAIETKLDTTIAEMVESAMAPYFGSMIAAGLIFGAVIQEAAHLADIELPRNIVQNASRHIAEIFKEGSQKTGGAQLDRETEPAVIAAVGIDDTAVIVIQKKVTIQLLSCWLAREAAVAAPLFIGQKADRHVSSISGGGACKTYRFCDVRQNCDFRGKWICKKIGRAHV